MAERKLVLVFTQGAAAHRVRKVDVEWNEGFEQGDRGVLCDAAHHAMRQVEEPWEFLCAYDSQSTDVILTAAEVGVYALAEAETAKTLPYDYVTGQGAKSEPHGR